MSNGRTYESLKQEIKIEKIDLYERENIIRIDGIASSAEYRMKEQFQNFQFFKPNFGFPD